MVWHLHIGLKLRSLEPPEVLSEISPDLLKKLKPPEWPLLEVRRFSQWCQGMSQGIIRRFREKNPQFFFRLCSSCFNFQRPHLLFLTLVCMFQKIKNKTFKKTNNISWNTIGIWPRAFRQSRKTRKFMNVRFMVMRVLERLCLNS